MVTNIMRLMIEAVVLYAWISWMLAFIALLAHRASTPGATLRSMAGQAALAAIVHPLALAQVCYGLALRAIAAFRK